MKMRISVFSALSLVLHLFLLFLLIRWKPSAIDFNKIRQPIEVVYVKKQPHRTKDEKTFVRQVKVPENMKFEDPKEAEFSSENRQRVIQQTRARKTGLTQNSQPGPKFLQETDPSDRTPHKEKQQKLADKGDFTIFNPKQEMSELAQGGESTISVQLPNHIAVGSFTALNTDRNLYYTFYSRLEDMIYLRWSDLIKRAVDSYSTNYKRSHLAGRTLKTDVIILLKPNGEFYQAQVFSASGVEKFDISPALAFQDARIFPNPPPEMVRSDGFIHISYSFVVDFGQVQ